MCRKTILVTGSSGFIGSLLVDRLLATTPHQVIGLTKRLTDIRKKNFISLNKDITSETCIQAIQKLNPDSIVHCAAISQVDVCESERAKCQKVNVLGTQRMVEAAKSVGAHFIYLSSDFVFDGSTDWVADDTSPNPISQYGKSKLYAEKMICESGLKWAIVRPVLVYGYSQRAARGNIFTWVVNEMLRKQTIKAVDDQYRTPTFVGDVIKLLCNIMENNSEGYFNIGGSTRVSVYEFAVKIVKQLNFNEQLVVRSTSDEVLNAHLRPKSSCFKNQRILSEFGWIPKTIEEGIMLAAEQMLVL